MRRLEKSCSQPVIEVSTAEPFHAFQQLPIDDDVRLGRKAGGRPPTRGPAWRGARV